MEKEPLHDLERDLQMVRGVRRVSVDHGEEGVTGVRLLVVPERSTEDARREVCELAERILGYPLPPRSVLVFSAIPDEAAPDHSRRRKLTSVSTERSEDAFTVKVSLELGGDVLVGEEISPVDRKLERAAVVQATLSALRELLEQEVKLEDISVLERPGERLVIVSLRMGSIALLGAAEVRLDEHDALARATLQAMNRSLSPSMEPATLA
jgi:hypothetical protein